VCTMCEDGLKLNDKKCESIDSPTNTIGIIVGEFAFTQHMAQDIVDKVHATVACAPDQSCGCDCTLHSLSTCGVAGCMPRV
jgi:uncharacterized protein YlzI (FlbEa/FlbD family)